MLNNELTDHIIKGCVALKRESQKLLYTSFYGYAMAICLRYASSEDDAMEMVNDGFLKLFKELPAFKPHYENHYVSLKGFIKQIMIFTAIDGYRKNVKHTGHKEIEDDLCELPFICTQSIDKMSYDELRMIVQRLSPAYRAVFNLFVIDGFTHEEISKQLNISVGTSKSNLAKARMNLQQMIKYTDREKYGRRVV